uniref:Transmembrane protein n=1 Tax=Steinernema glaseri TaxID=37863 RepID=A0A1I7ZNS5_9BILA
MMNNTTDGGYRKSDVRVLKLMDIPRTDPEDAVSIAVIAVSVIIVILCWLGLYFYCDGGCFRTMMRHRIMLGITQGQEASRRRRREANARKPKRPAPAKQWKKPISRAKKATAVRSRMESKKARTALTVSYILFGSTFIYETVWADSRQSQGGRTPSDSRLTASETVAAFSGLAHMYNLQFDTNDLRRV